MALDKPQEKPTVDNTLLLYAELTKAEIRAAQRRIKTGELTRVVPGVVTGLSPNDWPQLVARHRIRILAALFPGAIIGYRSAFYGGVPVDGILHLNYSYKRTVELPGLTVMLVHAPGRAAGDTPMMGRQLFFPSLPRVIMENLTISRGKVHKSVDREPVEERLLSICDTRGEEALARLREDARALAPTLSLEREFTLLDELIGSILGTRQSRLTTVVGKALTAATPYDAERLSLFELLASKLRDGALKQPASVVHSDQARTHFAFLESYFSNFIEGTEFDVAEARGFVLEGKPIEERPKDSHDILGVFWQALNPGWVNQTLAVGEAALTQLRERHADQMRERPEAGPGEFKEKPNRTGNSEFVQPKLVRGTLFEGSKILPSLPTGTARALFAMFLVTEVHPFLDGNGRLARLIMNSELSVVNSCRIIVPTLFRNEYLDCLRALTRGGNPAPFINAMQKIHEWTAAFDYQNLDKVIAAMKACNAFEKSRTQFKLLSPSAVA